MNLRRLLAASALDLTLALRNRTVAYVLVAPLAIALVFRFVFPALSQVRLDLVADADLPAAVTAELARYAAVTPVPAGALTDRVAREDDALGVRLEGGRLVLVTFGDEPEALIEMGRGALAEGQRVLDGAAPRALDVAVHVGSGSVLAAWRHTFYAVLGLLGLFAGLLAVSFNVMEDRVRRTFSALAVSPLGHAEYLVSKALAGGVLSVAVALGVLAVVGADVHWGLALAAAAAAVPMAAGLGLLLGLVSSSDVQLITYVKAASLVLLAPVLAVLLPAAWTPTLWWLPTYWLGRAFTAAVSETPTAVLGPALVAALLGSGLLLGAGRAMRGRLGGA